MKQVKKLLINMLAAVMLAVPIIPVQAADEATLEFEALDVDDTEDEVIISYNLYKDVQVTSGKMTITYDKNQLEYSDKTFYTDEDDAMPGMQATLNTPKSGNTQEGQLVFTFSSASPVTVDGCILDLYFTPKSPLKAGQKFDFYITVDELKNNETNVNVKVKQGSSTVLSGSDTEDDEDEEDEEDEEESQSQKQTTKSTNSTNSTKSSETKDTNTKGANAKTGDVTQILPWIGAVVLAVLILGGLFLSRKKEK